MNDEEIREEVVTCIDRRLLDLARDEVVRAINITIQKTRKQVHEDVKDVIENEKRYSLSNYKQTLLKNIKRRLENKIFIAENAPLWSTDKEKL